MDVVCVWRVGQGLLVSFGLVSVLESVWDVMDLRQMSVRIV
jgi:hypothetical protein